MDEWDIEVSRRVRILFAVTLIVLVLVLFAGLILRERGILQ